LDLFVLNFELDCQDKMKEVVVSMVVLVKEDIRVDNSLD